LIESALYRLLEVAIGGGVAVAVLLMVMPERAFGLGLDAAARILDLLARLVPNLLAGFTLNSAKTCSSRAHQLLTRRGLPALK
jgi:DMSO reductase anchor subunit